MPDQVRVSCPYCTQDAFPVFLRHQKRFLKCRECSLIFLHPDDRKAEDYSHHYTEAWIKEWRGEGREVVFLEALSYFPESAGRALLDVGCGGGKLLSMAAQAGWDVWGVDPSMEKESWACELARGRIAPALSALPPDIRFRAVCCVNVLDQIHNPWDILKQINGRMAQDSCLVIRLPNCRLHRAVHQVANFLPSLIRNSLLSWSIMHEYSLEPVFLCRMLKDAGFNHRRIMVSVASSGDVYSQGKFFMFFKRVLAFLLRFMSRLSGGKLLLTPSVLVVAHKQDIG